MVVCGFWEGSVVATVLLFCCIGGCRCSGCRCSGWTDQYFVLCCAVLCCIVLFFRCVSGVLLQMVTYNILKEQIEAASAITPGIQAPTVIELAQSGWVAMQAMVKRKEVPQKMEELVHLGATGIIATSIANCRLDAIPTTQPQDQ